MNEMEKNQDEINEKKIRAMPLDSKSLHAEELGVERKSGV